MTEEIIIDGVDVAGCKRFNKDTGYCKGAFKPEEEPYCQCFTCEYKQLKRLEQENKELKEENIEYDEELAIEKLSHKSDLETLERYRSALEEIKVISDNYNLTVNKRRKQIADKINEVLQCE